MQKTSSKENQSFTCAVDSMPDLHNRPLQRSSLLHSASDMVSLYRKMIVSCQPEVLKILSAICRHDFSSGGILWHCTAGKDLCGVITTYVLAALGVSLENIMVDYINSNEPAFQKLKLS